jgi:hypothetical protein
MPNNLINSVPDPYKNTALCLLWVNKEKKEFNKTIFAGNLPKIVEDKIVNNINIWKTNHPYLTIYIGYDSRFVTDEQLQTTIKIFPKETVFVDLLTLIDDEFISDLNKFTTIYIHRSTSANKYIYAGEIKPLPLNLGKIINLISQFKSLTKEFITDYVLGTTEIAKLYLLNNNGKNGKQEYSPVYFRVDMWRLILTLYLVKKYKYNYVIYTDIDIDPAQDALSAGNLFDDKTKRILTTIGFIVDSKQLNSIDYENSFHIINNNEKTINAILIVCIYMNIIRFKYYTLGMFKPDKQLCLDSAFRQIVYIGYKQLVPYLLYLYRYIIYYFKGKDEDGIDIMHEINEGKEIADPIELLGFNCRNYGISCCDDEQLYFKLILEKKDNIPFLQIEKNENTTIMTANNYYTNMPFGNMPIKKIDTILSTQKAATC